MPARRPRPDDPIALDLESIALHQSIAYEAPPDAWASALAGSLLFRTRSMPQGIVAEWIRASGDSESLRGPLATVTLSGGGCLLEAWSEARMKRLRHALEDAAGSAVAADASLVVSLEDALARPDSLLETRLPGSVARTPREIAAAYVRSAWAFVPRADLHGRLPVLAARTGRGLESIAAIAERAAEEIRGYAPSFPAMSAEDLRALLASDAKDAKDAARAVDAANAESARPSSSLRRP